MKVEFDVRLTRQEVRRIIKHQERNTANEEIGFKFKNDEKMVWANQCIVRKSVDIPIDESEENLGLLKRIRNERLIIEKDETILLECLDVHCHNKQCVAEDRREDMRPMTLWQKTVGRVFPLGYKPPPQGKDQK